MPPVQHKTVVIVGLVAVAVLLVVAAQGDLWLDEIWSLAAAQTATSPLELLTVYRHDNNHLLNTAYLYLAGSQQHFIQNRLLAIASGLGSLLLLTSLAGRRGRFEAYGLLLLAGTSYPLLLYFSEARGYAPAIFCALLAFTLLERHEHRLAGATLAGFWAAMLAGVLAHLTFTMVFLALLTLTTARAVAERLSAVQAIRRLAILYALPVLFLAGVYVGFARRMVVGGGDDFHYYEVVTRALLLLTGLPDGALFRLAAVLCYGATVAVGVAVYRRQRNPLGVFYPVLLGAAPLVLLLLTRPTVLYARYFVVLFPFYYLLLIELLGRLGRRHGVGGYALAVVLLALLTFGQAARVVPLLTHGRGGYGAAVRYLASQTAGTEIRVSSDNDYRNRAVLEFYASHILKRQRLVYLDAEASWHARPEWYLAHGQDPRRQPEPTLTTTDGDVYRLVETFRATPDSGWNWYLYRLRPAAGS